LSTIKTSKEKRSSLIAANESRHWANRCHPLKFTIMIDKSVNLVLFSAKVIIKILRLKMIPQISLNVADLISLICANLQYLRAKKSIFMN